MFCKSILNEYAFRMNLKKPSYQIIQPNATPRFASSLVFNGKTYKGEFARSKLEAQRLAARSVILSILDSELGNVVSEIVLSKCKMIYATQMGSMLGGVYTGNDNEIHLSKEMEMEVDAGTNGMPTPSIINEPCQGQLTSIPLTHLSLHVTQPPMSATASTTVSRPVTSMHPFLEQTPLVDSTITSAKKRNRKNKKKAQKKAQVEAQLPVDVALSAPMA